MAQAETSTTTTPSAKSDLLAAAHDELGGLDEVLNDCEMYAGLLAAADTDDGTARAGGKILDLIKEVERVRLLAWHATAKGAADV